MTHIAGKHAVNRRNSKDGWPAVSCERHSHSTVFGPSAAQRALIKAVGRPLDEPGLGKLLAEQP
jgi:hypothetical protein